MATFLRIGDDFLNVDYIERVLIYPGGARGQVTMASGEAVAVDAEPGLTQLKRLIGFDAPIEDEQPPMDTSSEASAAGFARPGSSLRSGPVPQARPEDAPGWWPDFYQRLRAKDPDLAVLVSHAAQVKTWRDQFWLRFRYQFHADQAKRKLPLIEEALRDTTGQVYTAGAFSEPADAPSAS